MAQVEETQLPALAAAQSDGRIVGTVRDSSSAFIPGATVTVKRLSDGADLPVQMGVLNQGYGDEATSWTFTQGQPTQPGTYRVHVTGAGSHPDFDYDVTLLSCP